MRYLFTLSVFLYSIASSAQTLKVPEDVYGLKDPVKDQGKSCTSCMQMLMQKTS